MTPLLRLYCTIIVYFQSFSITSGFLGITSRNLGCSRLVAPLRNKHTVCMVFGGIAEKMTGNFNVMTTLSDITV